jgi:hypothetical protein
VWVTTPLSAKALRTDQSLFSLLKQLQRTHIQLTPLPSTRRTRLVATIVVALDPVPARLVPAPAPEAQVIEGTVVHLPRGALLKPLLLVVSISYVFSAPHLPFQRQAPPTSAVLGVFGLSIRTQERDLEDEFNRFGRVEKVTIVYDQRVRICPVYSTSLDCLHSPTVLVALVL